MNNKKGTIIGLGLLAALGIYAVTRVKPTVPPIVPPQTGPANFTVRIMNLPSGANKWGCAFQDPATGEYYQPTNRPLIGSHLFDSSESAELSTPISSGVLSISAILMGATNFDVTQIVNYQIDISVTNNSTYTFDFSTGK